MYPMQCEVDSTARVCMICRVIDIDINVYKYKYNRDVDVCVVRNDEDSIE